MNIKDEKQSLLNDKKKV